MKYKLIKDKDFLKFIKREIRHGYKPLIDIENIDEIIDKIVRWYEFKYPTDFLIDDEFNEKYIDLSNEMTIEQLLLRLSEEETQLIKCDYTSTGGGNKPIYEGTEIVDFEPYLFFKIKNYNYDKSDYRSDLLIDFNPVTGKIDNNCFANFYTSKRKNEGLKIETINELYEYFKKTKEPNINYSQLERIIKDKEIDEKIRVYIIQYVEKNMKDRDLLTRDRYKIFKKEIKKYLKDNCMNDKIEKNDEAKRLIWQINI